MKPRVPPVWLVLLPALALAAVGVRAVTAEMRASEDAARERARSVASRLARSVDALVEEYAGPLPAAGTRITRNDASGTLAHLRPSVSYTSFQLAHTIEPSAGETPTRPEGLRLTRIQVRLSPQRRSLLADKSAAVDSALVQDALATARRMADDRGGAAGAAALLDATAQLVHDPAFRWPLRHAEAAYEASIGDRDAAVAAVREAWSARNEELVEWDGLRFPEAALVVAAECIGPIEPPRWFVDAFEYCARNPELVHEDSLDRIDDALASAFAARVRPLRRLAATARELAASFPSGHVATATMKSDRGSPCIQLWRSIEDPSESWVLLGGEIPQSVIRDRLQSEARALSSEPGVATVRLALAAGDHALDTPGAASTARDVVVDTVPLADPLSAWRAEAVVAPESGVPATAWMLAGALVLTTGALLAGTLALRRAAERSARLAEERQTFLDHVAHELRTPAAAIQALTEELASGHVAPERETLYREHLLRESRRLSNLVEDTLDLTRLDAGRLAFKMEEADLRDVVRRAIEESRDAGRVVATLPEAPVVRPVDEGTLRRAVKNLVENAVRHGGGDAPVTVALEARNGQASIVVTDKGRGIAAEHLPRLFERFYRVPSATHEVKGVGLGLALCREVARAHGGDVTVVSAVGKGSAFTMRLPVGPEGTDLTSHLPANPKRRLDLIGEVRSEVRPRRPSGEQRRSRPESET